MAVHASSGVLCCASSSSVTGLGLPPLQPRSFLERQRRIQSNRLHPGPSFPRLALLAFTSALLAVAEPFAFVFLGAARALLLMGQTAGIANALDSGSVKWFGFRVSTVGLEGGVELVANGEGGSWLINKDMAFWLLVNSQGTAAPMTILVQNKRELTLSVHAAGICKVSQEG